MLKLVHFLINPKTYLFSIILLINFYSNLLAATYTSRASGGNWTSSTSWNCLGIGTECATYPYPSRVGDIVNIGHAITVNTTIGANLAGVNINSGGILTIENNGKITLNGNLNLNNLNNPIARLI